MSLSEPLRALTIYSIAMVSLPIMAYFVLRSLFASLVAQQTANIYGAIGSVIVVHIILFMFVYRAYQEDKQISERTDKKD